MTRAERILLIRAVAFAVAFLGLFVELCLVLCDWNPEHFWLIVACLVLLAGVLRVDE